jgi:SAM-dependent methyltransferase
MSKGEAKKILHERLDAYEKVVKERIDLVRRRIDKDRYTDVDKNKVWLEQFVKGAGLDVCCGHIPMKGAEGVDSVWFYGRTGSGGLGPLCHLRVDGDDLAFYEREELDFIISNYFEAFTSPMKVLNEWYRVLKKGGVLALVLCNTEKYENELGPLANRNRANIYTKTTINLFLKRTGYTDIKIEEVGLVLRVQAKK